MEQIITKSEYSDNLEKYFELCNITFDKSMTEDELIDKLVDIAMKKREIQLANNAIISETLAPYEKGEKEIDGEVNQKLCDLCNSLRKGWDFFDRSISTRATRLRLKYAEATDNKQIMVHNIYYLLYYSLYFMERTAQCEGPQWNDMADKVLEYRATPGDRTYSTPGSYLFACVFNPCDCKNAIYRLKKAVDYCREFETDCLDKKSDASIIYLSALIDTLVLSYEAYRDNPEAFSPEEKEEIKMLVGEISEGWDIPNTEDMVEDVKIAALNGRFVSGMISTEEMLEELLSIFTYDISERYFNQVSQLFKAASEYVEILWIFSEYEKVRKVAATEDIFARVMRGYGQLEQNRDNSETYSQLSNFITIVSNRIGFTRMRDQILKMTVYANKPLYIHTLMVKTISMIILEAVINDNPAYLNGVAGKDASYIANHSLNMMSLMGRCALFHDIGKYYCLEFVDNSSRNLSDDEFRAIKYHPENFDRFFSENGDEEFNCIRDCARLHHLWHNGEGGYPMKLQHTQNRPFVDIISIADSIDAATDIIGRPYTSGKTLNALIEEFDTFRDTRYSGYITDVLKYPEVREKIERAIKVDRRHINYEIMTN